MHLHDVCCCATSETKMPLFSLSLFLSTHSRPPQTLCSRWACARLSCPRSFSHFITLTVFRLAFLSSNWSPCQPRCNLADSASFSKVEPKVRAVDSLSLLRGVESSGVHKTSLSTSVFYFLKVWRVNVVIVREVIWFLLKVYVQLRSILSAVLFLCLFSWKIEKVG